MNKEPNPSFKKLNDIIILRAISIFSVVFVHSYHIYFFGELKNMEKDLFLNISSIIQLSVFSYIRMPLFVFISGYLFSFLYFDKNKYRDYIGFTKDKINRLLIPYIIFSVIFSITIDKTVLLKSFFSGYAHLWFLLMLFECFVVGGLFIRIFRNYLWLGVLSGLFLNYIAPYIPTLFAINKFCELFIWFFMGCFLFKSRERDLADISIKKILTLTACLFFLLILKSYLLGYYRWVVVSLISAIGVLTIFYSINYLINNCLIKRMQLFERINKYSYGIFIYHFPLMMLVNNSSLGKNIAYNHTFLYPLCLFVFVLVVSFGMTKISLKNSIGRFLIG